MKYVPRSREIWKFLVLRKLRFSPSLSLGAAFSALRFAGSHGNLQQESGNELLERENSSSTSLAKIIWIRGHACQRKIRDYFSVFFFLVFIFFFIFLMKRKSRCASHTTSLYNRTYIRCNGNTYMDDVWCPVMRYVYYTEGYSSQKGVETMSSAFVYGPSCFKRKTLV